MDAGESVGIVEEKKGDYKEGLEVRRSRENTRLNCGGQVEGGGGLEKFDTATEHATNCKKMPGRGFVVFICTRFLIQPFL